MGRDGSMIEREIESEYMNETFTLSIYRPENYSPLYKYYLCIVQDGDDYYQLGRLARVSDNLHAEGKIENTIFCGIHYQDRDDRWHKYHPDSEMQENYMKFLRFEVVPILDKELPSYHVKSCRVLMGDSLGGTVSLMTALKYPNTFGKVIMQSPFTDERIEQLVKDSSEIDTMSIYHTIGLDEEKVETTYGDIEDFLNPNRKLNQLLEERVSDYKYKELKGKHTWKQWQKDLPNAIEYIFGK
ncbi:alpha/beta hydrolase [Alkalibacillus salilacus]|uniref:Enterochelin esterase-like enzyme n=1 Tax=Alkalibacillus salilacus TaxID=284582 RepID=A0ABT9VH31_9BACI|nr:alpha/beta hydrolase-fold protein [Alkalibacillus salilacus]MDQ0160268.1 enterochelin esterase-like enzyme [Alkalibacillus salilacus]